MKKKILHMLYTNDEKGGAQNFAMEIAKDYGVITSTIMPNGSFKLRMQREDLPYLDLYKVNLLEFDIIFLSDLKALIFYLKLYFFAKKTILKSTKVYFIPHSEKLLSIGFFLKHICKLTNINILPTTPNMASYFKKKLFLRVFNKIKFNKISLKKRKLIVFHGRFSQIKRIPYIIDFFIKSNYFQENNYKLLIIGSGDFALNSKIHNVYCFNKWYSFERISKLLSRTQFVINATKYEGISLQLLEGLSYNCYPLVFSESIAKNLNLKYQHHCVIASNFQFNFNFDAAEILKTLDSNSYELGELLQ